MGSVKKKAGFRGVVILCIALFIAGYVTGSLFPLPMFQETGFFGAMVRPGGSGGHRR